MDSFPAAQYTMKHIPRIFVDDINSVLYKTDPCLFRVFYAQIQAANTPNFFYFQSIFQHRLCMFLNSKTVQILRPLKWQFTRRFTAIYCSNF
jgi:hypothetical protein